MLFKRDALAAPSKNGTRGVERVNVLDLKGNIPAVIGEKRQIQGFAEIEKMVSDTKHQIGDSKGKLAELLGLVPENGGAGDNVRIVILIQTESTQKGYACLKGRRMGYCFFVSIRVLLK